MQRELKVYLDKFQIFQVNWILSLDNFQFIWIIFEFIQIIFRFIWIISNYLDDSKITQIKVPLYLEIGWNCFISTWGNFFLPRTWTGPLLVPNQGLGHWYWGGIMSSGQVESGVQGTQMGIHSLTNWQLSQAFR